MALLLLKEVDTHCWLLQQVLLSHCIGQLSCGAERECTLIKDTLKLLQFSAQKDKIKDSPVSRLYLSLMTVIVIKLLWAILQKGMLKVLACSSPVRLSRYLPALAQKNEPNL